MARLGKGNSREERFLQLPISEPFTIDFATDLSDMTKQTILEFDLVKGTVKLPEGGFVCSLASLAHVVDKALIAQKRLNQERASDKKRLREGYYR